MHLSRLQTIGELAKLHRANKECASSVTVYLAATPQSYSTKPYPGSEAVVDLSGKVAPLTGRVAGIEIRVDPLPVCGGVEAYNERSLCVKYRSQRVQTSFYESTPSASDSLGNTIPQRVTEDSGNARANIHNASVERNLRNISRHSRVLFEHIPGMQGVWRVASSYRLKTTEPPHRRSSLSHAHHKLSAEYHQKRRLRVQNRSAGCILSLLIHPNSRKYRSTLCIQKQGI